MGLAGFILATVVAVPPGDLTANHAQPYHWGQPTIRRFEREAEDDARRSNWELYCRELDGLWKQYRRAGSTPRAWQAYRREAAQAKRRFVINDPYFAPIVDFDR